jgi:hypothetical protein
MKSKPLTTRDLRHFGWIVGVGFAIIGLWPAVVRHSSPRLWPLTLAGILSITALVAPKTLRPFFRVWMAIGGVLGWVNTHIILGIVYYLLIVPMGAIQRWRKHDPLERALDKNISTYKTARAKRPPSHMQHQY